jgi:hypothetical protein
MWSSDEQGKPCNVSLINIRKLKVRNLSYKRKLNNKLSFKYICVENINYK